MVEGLRKKEGNEAVRGKLDGMGRAWRNIFAGGCLVFPVSVSGSFP